ncbi:ATP-dependent zinc protease family protein [Oceanospirillum linum]|uniref:Retropepsin-like aspartic endopeptidase domain-containing protein n=1 Tax=Oceanospirillum linum TaxID=966 RepID=A0A1T1HDT1_OCELI|nr:ATP-dependent zinc protease [Oceanospirillum linum]OOV88018.1 hypothetical protein BTA35_0200185 [Oceanospirillum linum]SEF40479.1 Uncharacterized conserved protein [Oleiphilus messinensis]SMP00464.1 Uncharacterized conserved protein [Oceanospirillum linum]
MCFKRANRSSTPHLILSLLSVFTLAGCALDSDKPMLQAIQSLDARLEQRINNLEEQNQTQSTQLDQLQQQLKQGDQAISQLKANQTKLLALVEEKNKDLPRQPETPDTDTDQSSNSPDKVVLGSKEWVWLDAAQANFKARIDSGATTSSIHAADPVFFERNGEEWVRFNLLADESKESLPVDQSTESPPVDEPTESLPEDKAKESKGKQIEAPVVRWVRIIQASAKTPERRPVIQAWVQVGGLRERAEFTLADRSKMTFQILLGREFFKDIALIDVGKSYIHPKQKP